ncbi:MAG: helix-hairpin-helix domain-containing protein [Lachnospiraceae bacterium]|nr:helix-hairpin-helix domain-containing protein [Lachnospiraceae bacterium]
MRKKSFIIILVMATLMLVACGDKAELYMGAAAGTDVGADTEVKETAIGTEGTETVSGSSSKQSLKEEQLACYVCGAVVMPGVYYLTEGSRKQEAVLAAGGFTEAAAQSFVNLAERVKDGEKIYIPTEDELEAGKLPVDSDFDTDAGTSAEADSGLINLNTADKNQLMTLPGIGEAKADSIIAYRDGHGGFKSPEEILEVQGIKDGIYNKIKDKVTVD